MQRLRCQGAATPRYFGTQGGPSTNNSAVQQRSVHAPSVIVPLGRPQDIFHPSPAPTPRSLQVRRPFRSRSPLAMLPARRSSLCGAARALHCSGRRLPPHGGKDHHPPCKYLPGSPPAATHADTLDEVAHPLRPRGTRVDSGSSRTGPNRAARRLLVAEWCPQRGPDALLAMARVGRRGRGRSAEHHSRVAGGVRGAVLAGSRLHAL